MCKMLWFLAHIGSVRRSLTSKSSTCSRLKSSASAKSTSAKKHRSRPIKRCTLPTIFESLESAAFHSSYVGRDSQACCSEASKQHNEQRLKVRGTQQRLIKDVFQAAKDELKKQAAGGGYADLVSDLLVQVRVACSASTLTGPVSLATARTNTGDVQTTRAKPDCSVSRGRPEGHRVLCTQGTGEVQGCVWQ